MKFDICGSMHTCVRGNACMYPPPKKHTMHVNAHLNTRFARLLNAIKNLHAHECMKGNCLDNRDFIVCKTFAMEIAEIMEID